jgi:CHASE2 domain-containing sensor protein
MGATALVWGIKELKWLQASELRIYDQILRSRPQEAMGAHILLVSITQEDLMLEQWSLSDQTINK